MKRKEQREYVDGTQRQYETALKRGPQLQSFYAKLNSTRNRTFADDNNNQTLTKLFTKVRDRTAGEIGIRTTE